MEDKIEIRCPHCSSAFKVRNVEGIERKAVKCPNCGEKSPFVRCKRVEHDDRKDLGTDTSLVGQKKNSGYAVGKLVDTQTGASYQLQVGQNIIGREASSSQANVMLDTRGERRMSREHAVVDVKYVDGRGYVHSIGLYKQDVNPTLLNGTQLVYPEKIRMKDGDIVDFPGVRVRFVIPERETTAVVPPGSDAARDCRTDF